MIFGLCYHDFMGGCERSTGSDPGEGMFEEEIRLVPNAGWPECYFGIFGHICNAVHVSEGLDKHGQLYTRRDWALNHDPPEDCHLHDWQPGFDPDNGDTFEAALEHLNGLTKLEIISPEEQSRIEGFYQRLFAL